MIGFLHKLHSFFNITQSYIMPKNQLKNRIDYFPIPEYIEQILT